MGITIIAGSQWGDEGKGKVTDYYGKDMEYVVRFQGGNNAGHTVVVGDKVFKFHLLPSGVVQDKICCIGAGVVLDPKVLLKELNEFGKKVNLFIDPRVQIIMPYHILLDSLNETNLAKQKIGTTGRGIGPCYADRASRVGIRFDELINKDAFGKKLDKVLSMKFAIIEKVFGIKAEFTKESIFEEYSLLGEKLKEYLGDISIMVNDAINEGKEVMFEGAQGTFLDNDFGTYPFVTASHPISGGAFTGIGLGVRPVERIVGIVKAYTTRVGEGPFITELNDELGERIRKEGNEFGTTTGRPRRVGWLDLNLLRTSHRLNNFSEIAITKLDVLNGLDELKVAVSYNLDGKEVLDFPTSLLDVAKATPNYKTFKGFNFNPAEIKKESDLPKEAIDYINFIEKEIGVKIKIVSVGPEREQTIIR